MIEGDASIYLLQMQTNLEYMLLVLEEVLIDILLKEVAN
jgi:hypothetical protein